MSPAYFPYRRPARKAITFVLSWFLLRGRVALYFQASHARHAENPDDKVAPSLAQFAQGVTDAVLKPADDERWTPTPARSPLPVSGAFSAACSGPIPLPAPNASRGPCYCWCPRLFWDCTWDCFRSSAPSSSAFPFLRQDYRAFCAADSVHRVRHRRAFEDHADCDRRTRPPSFSILSISRKACRPNR